MTVSDVAKLLATAGDSQVAIDRAANWLAAQADEDAALDELTQILGKDLILNEDLNLNPQIELIRKVKAEADKKKAKKGKK